MKTLIGKKGALEFIKLYSRNPDKFQIDKILLKEGFSNHFIQEFIKLGLKEKILFKSIKELEQMYKEKHQGIVIIYKEKKEVNIELKNQKKRPSKTLSIKQMLKQYPGIYVLTDRIQDPQNLGSMIRTVEALGGMALFVTGKGASINETVQKVATSSLLYLPVLEISNAYTIIEEAKKLDYWIIATTTKSSNKTVFVHEISKLPKTEKMILMMGSESDGLKPILLEHSDFFLEIPLLGHTESLNVNQALSIALYKLIEFIYF